MSKNKADFDKMGISIGPFLHWKDSSGWRFRLIFQNANDDYPYGEIWRNVRGEISVSFRRNWNEGSGGRLIKAGISFKEAKLVIFEEFEKTLNAAATALRGF